MSVKCSDIMSDQNVKLAGNIQNLVGQCPMTDCYFQLWDINYFVVVVVVVITVFQNSQGNNVTVFS